MTGVWALLYAGKISAKCLKWAVFSYVFLFLRNFLREKGRGEEREREKGEMGYIESQRH